MLQVNFRTLRMTFLIHIQVSESHRLLLSKKKNSESKWSILINGVLIFSISIKHHLKKIVRIVKEHGLSSVGIKNEIVSNQRKIFRTIYITVQLHDTWSYYYVVML